MHRRAPDIGNIDAYLFPGGSDDTEPWTSAWLGGVVVKCAEKSGK